MSGQASSPHSRSQSEVSSSTGSENSIPTSTHAATSWSAQSRTSRSGACSSRTTGDRSQRTRQRSPQSGRSTSIRRVLHKPLGLTGNNIARKIGVSQGYVSNIENTTNPRGYYVRRYEEVLRACETERLHELINGYPEETMKTVVENYLRGAGTAPPNLKAAPHGQAKSTRRGIGPFTRSANSAYVGASWTGLSAASGHRVRQDLVDATPPQHHVPAQERSHVLHRRCQPTTRGVGDEPPVLPGIRRGPVRRLGCGLPRRRGVPGERLPRRVGTGLPPWPSTAPPACWSSGRTRHPRDDHPADPRRRGRPAGAGPTRARRDHDQLRDGQHVPVQRLRSRRRHSPRRRSAHRGPPAPLARRPSPRWPDQRRDH